MCVFCLPRCCKLITYTALYITMVKLRPSLIENSNEKKQKKRVTRTKPKRSKWRHMFSKLRKNTRLPTSVELALVLLRNKQLFLFHEWHQDVSKLVRVHTLNHGILTGKTEFFTRAFRKRRIVCYALPGIRVPSVAT